MGWGWAASHSQHGLKADFLIMQKGDPRDASCIAATTRRPPRTPHAPPGAPRAQRLLPRHPAVRSVWGPEPAFLLSQPRSPTVCPRPERLPVLVGPAELGSSLASIIDPRAPLASRSAGSLGPVCLLAGSSPVCRRPSCCRCESPPHCLRSGPPLGGCLFTLLSLFCRRFGLVF